MGLIGSTFGRTGIKRILTEGSREMPSAIVFLMLYENVVIRLWVRAGRRGIDGEVAYNEFFCNR
jgi:hypothetical protein